MTYFDFAQRILMIAVGNYTGRDFNVNTKFEDLGLFNEQTLKAGIYDLLTYELFNYFPGLRDRVSGEQLYQIGLELNSPQLSLSSNKSLGQAASEIAEILAQFLPGDPTTGGRD